MLDYNFTNLLKQIYQKLVDATNIPPKLAIKTASHIIEAVEKGYKPRINIGADVLKMIQMKENVYLWSGAKTFQYVYECQNIVAEYQTFEEFQKFCEENITQKYYDTWLKTEYNTANSQGIIQRRLQEIDEEKEIFPWVKYVASPEALSDERCLKKDGTFYKVGSPELMKYKPLTHYNCNCILEQHQDTEDLKQHKQKQEIEPNDYGFRTDIGEIFDKTHPYFDIPQKYKKYARKNFNLPKNII